MIRVMIVDDEKPALEDLEYHLKKYKYIKVVSKIQKVNEVFASISQEKPDAIFLDVDMPEKNGLKLSQEIKKLNKDLIIIFVSAYSQYALESFNSFPLDYIMKPISERRLKKSMDQLLYIFEQKMKENMIKGNKKIVKCFHKFQVISNDYSEVKFPTRQTKEMLAYLICHYERQVTRKELINYIFGGIEDKKNVNLLHVTAYKLRNLLVDAGVQENQMQISGNYILKAADGICDYIDFVKFYNRTPFIDKENIEKSENIMNTYEGPYLQDEDYIWADEIRTQMELQYEKLVFLMSDYYYESGEFEKFEKILITLINYNQLNEKAYSRLLDYFIKTDKQDKYIKIYIEYEEMLRKELSIKPATRFHNYYKDFVNGKTMYL